MDATVASYLNNVQDFQTRRALQLILNPIADRLSSQTFSSAGLVIKAGGSAIVKSGSRFDGIAQGVPVTKAANTDMAALVGSVANATFNVFCFYFDTAGTLTTRMGIAAATYAGVVFPTVIPGQAMIGYVLINPTGTGPFVGGTTPLDDATVVPNAVYVNTIGAFDTTVKLPI
jgi:hypothetical protein